MERERLNEIVGKNASDIRSNFYDYYLYNETSVFGHIEFDKKCLMYKAESFWEPIAEYKAINLEKGINDLEKYYLTFDLGSRLDGVLLNNFYIEISGFSVEDCLVHLIQIHSLKFKDCFITSKKPVALRPLEVIDNCYSQYINSRKVNSIKSSLQKKNILNIEELWKQI